MLFIILLYLSFSYVASNRDIMEPAVLLVTGYLIACVSCIYNIDNWGVDMHANTVVLLSVGIICFVLGDAFSCALQKKHLSKNEMSQPHYIYVSDAKTVFFVLFYIVVLVLAIKDMISVAGGWMGTLNSTMNEYRAAFSYNDVRTSTLVVQLQKICKGSAYVYLYIFFNNFWVSKSTGKAKPIIGNIKYLLPVITYAILTLFRSGRLNIIMIMVAGLFYFYFIWHRIVGWNRVISWKFVKRLIIAFVVFCVVFFVTREMVGRQNKSTFVDYLTMYLGGSFQLLDQFMENSIDTISGYESFPGILMSFRKLGLYDQYIRKSLEFRTTPTGVYLGNIYTGIRRFYHDYSMLGVVVMQFLYGYLFGSLYKKIQNIRNLDTRKLSFVIIYGTLLFAPLTQAMEDHFWIDLSVGFLIELIIIRLCVFFVMEFRIGSFKLIRRRWNEEENR